MYVQACKAYTYHHDELTKNYNQDYQCELTILWLKDPLLQQDLEHEFYLCLCQPGRERNL